MTLTTKKLIGDLTVAACAIGLAAAYLIATYNIRTVDIVDPLGPKAYPALLGIVMLACGLGLGIKVLARGFAAAEADSDTADELTGSRPLAVFAVGAWMLAYFLVFEHLGFLLSSMIFILGLTAFFNRGRWLINIAVAILFPVVLELVLSYLLGRVPAPGIWSF